MIKSVFKPTRKKNGKSVRSRIYWGQYRVDQADKISLVSLKTTDKRVAEQRLEEIVREVERERAGIAAPRALRDGAAKALTDHLMDFTADLVASGRSPEYVRKIESRCRLLLKVCGWTVARDVTLDSFLCWRRGATQSPRTRNHYLDAITALLLWMRKTARLDVDPLAGVSRVEARGRSTFERRALTEDECRRLLIAAPKRRAVYLTALQTGLRFSELRALVWGDVSFGASPPRIVVRAATTKNRKQATILLPDEVVAALRKLKPSCAGLRDPVFANGIPSHHTVQADLKRSAIERFDERGRKVDFHALRVTFITNLQRAGVARRVAMELARHSDPRLTERVYTDADALPLIEAVAALPRLTGNPEDAQIDAQRRTQTVVLDSHAMTSPGKHDQLAEATQDTELDGLRDDMAGQERPAHDPLKKWSRGDSNPRPRAAVPSLLRA